MRLIILTLCLAPLASAAFATLSWCASSGMYTDPMMHTQQFRPFRPGGSIALIGMDSSSEFDKSLTCQALQITDSGEDGLIGLMARDGNGNTVAYMGNLTFQNNNNYMKVKALEEADLQPDTSSFPQGALGANGNGEMHLYVLYFSGTEMVIRTCVNSFFGSEHSMYIFSTQPELVTALDPECMAETLKSLPHSSAFKPVMKSYEDDILPCFPSSA